MSWRRMSTLQPKGIDDRLFLSQRRGGGHCASRKFCNTRLNQSQEGCLSTFNRQYEVSVKCMYDSADSVPSDEVGRRHVGPCERGIFAFFLPPYTYITKTFPI